MRGRARAATVLDRVLASRDESNGALARRLEITESVVRDLRAGVAGLAVGDLYAMPQGLSLELLDAVRTEIESGTSAPGLSPERHVMRAQAELGDVARELEAALADGQIDDAERARLRREAVEARDRLDQLIRDLDATAARRRA